MKIIVDSVGKYFGEKKIFTNLSFEVSSGKSVAITGPNGSGKTTLLRIISGLINPTEGTVKYFENSNHLTDKFDFDLGIGIATGDILVVKAGQKGETNQDLIWIGNPTNFASKLANVAAAPYNINISKEVFSALPTNLKICDEINIWEEKNRITG